MTQYRTVTDIGSGLFETCARHTERHTCRLVQSAYFCDECTERLVREAFNGRAPIYNGESLQGYCGLCNRLLEVTIRHWFVCGPCWSFIVAYQKSLAATAGLREWWEGKIQPSFSQFSLNEVEPMTLLPFARSKKTKLEKAASLQVLDFVVTDKGAKPEETVFHIEQKAGPGSIEAMTEFQLDVNDYNDIAGAMNSTRIPAYIIHVQVEHEYAPPTRKTKVVGMWWTDIYTIYDKRKRIGPRRGTDKRAIYFKPSAFKRIDTFEEELRSEGYKTMMSLLKNEAVGLIS